MNQQLLASCSPAQRLCSERTMPDRVSATFPGRVTAALLIPLFALTIGAAETTFEKQQYVAHPGIVSLIHADLNGDGVQDLISASQASASIEVYIANGN